MSEPRYSLGDFNTVAGQAVSGNGSGPEHDSWLPLNLSFLPEEPPIQPILGGFGLVYPGKRHVFSGPQESAKTLAAYAIGLETIRDHNTTVILIDFEMGAYGARDRLRDLGATANDLARIHYIEPHEPATPDRISVLVALAPMLVIVDAAAGAYDIQGLDDNKRGDVERFSHLYVRHFWQAGIATIILDHVVKNTETRGKYAIGSERKTGGVDVHLGFDTIIPVKRGSRGLYKITTHKDRDGYLQRGQLAELELESCPDTSRISWTFNKVEHAEPGEPWFPTKVMQKISGLLEQEPEPVSCNSLIDLAGGKRQIALQAIDHLVRLGYASETRGSNRTRLIQHQRPFTILEWENEDSQQVVPGGSQVVPGTTQPPVVPPVRSTGDTEPPGDAQNHPVVPEPPNPHQPTLQERAERDTQRWLDQLNPDDDQPL